jgi:hypothetical protein
MSINAQPFNPTFKLVGNLAEDQILVFDVSENAFVNSANSGGGGASGFTAIENVGATGTAIHYGEAGTTLQLKKLIGGDNLTITDNGTGGLILAATNTDTIQDGTNLGTGTGLFSSKDSVSHALQFKSLAVGAGLTLTDDGNGTITLVNTIAAGTTDADLTLSNLSDVVVARTNLDVYSKTEGDARYHDKFSNFLPSQNNIYDIGSPTLKFNDIYAETFQGTAVLADQLTISGTSGQVLTHNGSEWVAGAGSSVLSSASDMSNVAPADGQHLVWNSGTSLWTPSSAGEGGGGYSDSSARAAISVTTGLSYNNSTGVIGLNASISDLLDVSSSGVTNGQVLKWNSTTSVWEPGDDTSGSSYGDSDVTSHLATFDGHIIPDTDVTYDLGSSSKRFRDLYLSGSTIDLGGTTLKRANGTGKLQWDGDDVQDYNNLSNKPDLSQITNPGGNPFLRRTDLAVTTGSASGSGALSYNTGNGSFTFTPADLSSYLTSVPAQTFASLTGKPTTLAGYGITDGGGSYDNASVDTHLNVSGATANQMLKWTGTDYAWVTSTDSDTTYTAGSGLTLNGTEFSLTSGHFDGAFSSLTGKPTTLAGYGITDGGGDVTGASTTTLTSETDSQTLSLSGTTLTISTGNNVDLGALTLDDFADVTITSVSDGQFLTYNNGTGDWENSTVSIPTLTSQLTNDAGFITSASTYSNSDVDSHLNQSNPTSGYVLSWNGSDYAWVSNGAAGAHYNDADARAAVSASTGLSYNSGTGVFSLNSELGGLSNVSSSAPTSGQVLKWNGSAWAPAADVDTDTVYTTFTSDFDTRLATKTTANLSEDASNKYFTDARARSAISVSGDLTYNSSTGVISYSEPTMYANSDVDSHLNSGSATSGQILSWTGTDYDWILNDNNTPPWADISSKPTTIAGFGITDAFDGAFSSLTGKPTTIAGYGITDAVTPTSSTTFTNKSGNISQWTNDTGFITSVPAQTFASLTGKPTTIAGYGITDAFDGAFSSLTGKPTTVAGYGITDAVTPTSTTTFTNKSGNISQWTNDSGYLVNSDLSGYAQTSNLANVATSGNYSDLSGTPTMYANSDVDSHLNISSASTSDVLSWNGSDFAWVAQSSGGNTDKIEEGNSSVEVIDGGANGHVMFNTNGSDRWQVSNSGHILPEATETYDIGSATNKVRHLYLSDTSLYIGSDTLRTNSSNLLFNGDDVQDYANLKNKPDTTSAGTGIQINSGVISLNSTLSGLSNVSSTAPSTGQVLKWSGSEWAPGTDVASGTAAMNDLTDVSTAGISSGDVLSWNGSSFVATTPSSGGASAINDLSDVDTTTSAPSNGDVLTWSASDSEWTPAAPSGGGGGSGATIEYFKLNYATNGNLSSITNATSGVSATILSATGGDVEVSFSSTNYPPSGIMIYGYAYSANEYNIKNAHADMNTRKMSGGGSSGSPIAFGSMGSVDLTLDLREASTGAGRSFGTTTHAWVMFTTV